MDVVAEILEAISDAIRACVDALDVVADSSEEGSEVISISDTFDLSLSESSSDIFGELLEDDFLTESTFEGWTESSTSEAISWVEDSGVASEEAASQVGSDFSNALAEQQAGDDAVASFPEAPAEPMRSNVAQSPGPWFGFLSGLAQRIPGLSANLQDSHQRKGFWARTGCALDIAGTIPLIESIHDQIVNIVDIINDQTKNPPWKGSLTEEQKEQLKKLMDASNELDPLMKSLDKAVQPLQKNPYGDYGTLEVHMGSKTKVVNVVDVVGYTIQDVLKQIDQAHDILKNGIENLSVSDLKQLCNFVFTVFVDVQSLIKLRDNKDGKVKDDQLGKVQFPSPSEDKRVNYVLTTCFPQWKAHVQYQVKSLAQYGAGVAISAFVKAQVIMKVNDFLETEIYPQVKEAAKPAGQTAAKAYVESKKAGIVSRALIPIVGSEKAREYGEQVQKDAIKKAQEAARQAGKAKAEELKSSIQEQLKAAVQGMLGDNKDAMKEIGMNAAKEILSSTTPSAS